jgi:hypothetical protein
MLIAARVEMLGMLLYADVRLGNVALIRETMSLLRKRVHSKRIVNWPGVMAPYALGRISDEAFELAAHDSGNALLERRLCQRHFYRAVIAYERGDTTTFERFMRTSARSGYGFLEDEYYLANWEVAEGFPDVARG